MDREQLRISGLTGVDLRKQYKAPMETLFLTSPNEFTPFHIDSEDSFLLQIQGTKTIYIFDGRDSEILNSRDIEKYWAENEIKMREEIRDGSVLPAAALARRDACSCFLNVVSLKMVVVGFS